MIRSAALALLCLMTAPAFADEKQIAAFTQACLGPAMTRDAVAEVAAQFDANLPDADPPPSILSPLVIPEEAEAWLYGDPEQRAASDLGFGFSTGRVFDAPATGCAVLGYSQAAKPLVATVLAGFENHRYIAVTEDDLLPGSRYWLVEHAGEKAVFSASLQDGLPNLPTVVRLAFERLDPEVIDLVLSAP